MGDNAHLPEGCSTFARQKWHQVKSGLDGSNLRFVPIDLDRKSSGISITDGMPGSLPTARRNGSGKNTLTWRNAISKNTRVPCPLRCKGTGPPD